MDKVKCKICGFESLNLVQHLRKEHNLSTLEYFEIYGKCRIRISPWNKGKSGEKCRQAVMKGLETRKKNYDKWYESVCKAAKDSERNKKISESKTGISRTEEHKKAISKGTKKGMAKMTDEAKERRSRRAKRWYASPEGQEFLRGNALKAFKHNKKKSRPEKIMESYLIALGFIDEFIFSPTITTSCIPDFVSEKRKIIIQVYSDYYHGNPLFWKGKEIPEMIQKRMKKDREDKNMLEGMGYTVYEYWERDILNNPVKVIECLKKNIM